MNKKSLSSVRRLLIGCLLGDRACPHLSLPVWSRGRQLRVQAGTKWRDRWRLSKRRPPERFNSNSATTSRFPPLQWFLLFHWFLLRPAGRKDTALNSVRTVCVCVHNELCILHVSNFKVASGLRVFLKDFLCIFFCFIQDFLHFLKQFFLLLSA